MTKYKIFIKYIIKMSFRLKVAEYNSPNLQNLAGSLAIALNQISANSAINITNLQSNNLKVVNNLTIPANITIPTNASTGYVLTCINSTGTAQWQSESQVITFTGVGFTHSMWNVPQTTTMRFTKNGNLVNIGINSVIAPSNSASFIESSPIILPLSYVASSIFGNAPEILYPIIIDSNNTFTGGQFQLNFNNNPTGAFIFFDILTINNGIFGGGGGNSGFQNISITYPTDI